MFFVDSWQLTVYDDEVWKKCEAMKKSLIQGIQLQNLPRISDDWQVPTLINTNQETRRKGAYLGSSGPKSVPNPKEQIQISASKSSHSMMLSIPEARECWREDTTE